MSVLLATGLAFSTPAVAQTMYFAGATSTLGSGFTKPVGVAVDGSGNVWAVDQGANFVYRMTPGCASASCVTTLGSGLSSPYGVAVDAGGNVYVADFGNHAVKKILAGTGGAGAGTVNSSSTIISLGGGFNNPYSVAVDGNGNVYVADYGGNRVNEISASCIAGANNASCVTTLGGTSTFSHPLGVAVDTDGDEKVWVVDYGSNSVYRMTPNCASISCVTTLGIAGLSIPYEVAVDGNGNVYVANQGSNAVKEILAETGGAGSKAINSSSTVIGLSSGFNGPQGVAVDGSGNVYVADFGNNAVKEIQLSGVNFRSVAVATSTPATATLKFNFTAGGMIQAPLVLTQGAAGLDFTDAGTGTCSTNGTGYTYAGTDSCTVIVRFVPSHSGMRNGAVQVRSSTGSVISTAFLTGSGTAPEVIYSPTAISTLGGGFWSPYGVAVDGSGNVYVADATNHAVKEMMAAGGAIPASPTIQSLGGAGSFSFPSAVAVDGSGSIYVADSGNGAVYEMTPDCTSSSCVTTLAGGSFSVPSGVAVDGNGNVYVADSGKGAVYEMTPGCTSSSCVTTLGGISWAPSGVAVDGNGNVYVTDSADTAVYEMTPGCMSSSCVTTLGGDSAWSSPSGVAVDGNGNVYLADQNNVYEMTPSCASSACVTPLGSTYRPFIAPMSAVVDGSGNVYIADNGPVAGVYEIGRAAPPTLSFATATPGGSTDTTDGTDGALSVTITNNGNTPLTAIAPGLSVAANFTQVAGDGTPEDCTASFSLAPDASCNLSVEFAPVASANGAVNGSVTLTDNNLNASPSATQTISLAGTATQPQAVTQLVPVPAIPATVVLGGNLGTVNVDAEDEDGNLVASFGDPVALMVLDPDENVIFLQDPNATSGIASFDLSGATLTVTGGYTIIFGSGLIQNTVTFQVVAPPPPVTPGGGLTGYSVLFGSTAVGQSTSATATLMINTSLTLVSATAGGDFAITDASGCTINSPLTQGANCVLAIQFTPAAPGQRWYPLVLTDSNGVRYSFGLAGFATGAAVSFPPGWASDFAGKVGSPGYSGDNGPAAQASLNFPTGIVRDPDGNFYIADTQNCVVRKVDTTGTIATFAGNNNCGYSGDSGAATSAQLGTVAAVALDAAGNLYIADSTNDVIRKVDVNGVITTFAGVGYSGYDGDGGPATQAPLNNPTGVATDNAGNVYIADTRNNVIREVYASGNIDTIAGTGQAGYSGDNDDATDALLNTPQGIAVDNAGNLYIADSCNNAIRKVDGDGTITTVAGNGNAGYSGDGGAATAATLSRPLSVAVDGAGDLFLADSHNAAVRKVDPNGIITTVAGGGAKALPQPKMTPITGIHFYTPSDAIADASGNLYIVDNNIGIVYKADLSTPATLSFGSVNVGQSSAAQSVAVGNAGNAPLQFSQIGASDPQYVLLSGAGMCGTGTPVAGSSSCILSVELAPTAGGVSSASLALTDNAPTTPQNIQLSGSGVVPLRLSPSSGALPPGTVGIPYSQTFTASGGTGSYMYGLSDDLPDEWTITKTGGVLAATPASAGSYSFTVTARSGSNSTSQDYSLTVNAGTATVTLGSLEQTYTGRPLAATATTAPANLTVNFTYSQNGQPVAAPTSAGSYAVTATISDSNYTGTAGNTLLISKATASVTLGSLAQTYTGSPLAATATTIPTGLTVTFTYTGIGGTSYASSSTPPTAAGSYAVVGTISDANYTGTATGTLIIAAAARSITFNVRELAFGSVPLGFTSQAQTVIVSNPNLFAVPVSGIQASGDFAVLSACPTIAALSSCSINVTFTPGVTGASTGTLTVTDAFSGNPQSIPLTGTGTAALIQIAPASLNFGSQMLTTTSNGQTLAISNSGTADLVISDIETSGDFSTNGSCTTVPAGSDCSLAVTFTPAVAGSRTGTVTLTDNVGGSSSNQVVNLSGSGTLAGVSLTPAVLSFPGTLVGTTSFGINVILTNSGTAPLTSVSVADLGDFAQTNTCAGTLAAGASCVIGAKYTPTIPGAESGSIIVTDSLGTQTVSLTGTGLMPGASLSNAQLIFGGQLVNTSSLAQTVVFTNSGSAPVNILSVTPSSNFGDTTNCSGSIAAGASCSVNVIFKPASAGPVSGTVSIADTAGTQVITAQGQGVSPGLTVSPSFAIFGAQLVGSTSQAQTLIATNTGAVSLTLNPIAASNNFPEFDNCPAVLGPGASCAISLSFSPNSTGALSGSLVLSDTSGLVSTLVAISGQGTLPGIASSPSALSFGSLPAGTTSQAQTVTVSNTGAAPLAIGTVSGAGDFTETDTCSSTTLAVGSYCIISVTMTPTTTGTRTGTIQIVNDADGAHLIALTGMGQQTGVSVSPTSLAFGSQPVVSQGKAVSGAPLSVTVTNTGSLPLQLGGFQTQGDFAESDSCGGTVAVGATCTLNVTFAPVALGHRTGTLTITDNAGGGTQMVSLEGDGNAAGLTLSPPVLNFGVQTVGAVSLPQTVTLSNNTGSTFTGLAVTASGEFNENDNCGGTLANRSSCALNISVTPVISGAITGTITVSGSSGTIPASPALSGTRTAARLYSSTESDTGNSTEGVVALTASAIPPGIGLSIPSLSFSVSSVGTPTTGQTLVLQNTGTAASLTGLTIGETNAQEFPFTNNCPGTLPAQARCTIVVNFTPAAIGLRASVMNITADGGISAALPESGTAVAPVTQLGWASSPAASVLAGGNAGSSIGVFEESSNGSVVTSASDGVTIDVAGPNGYSKTYSAVAVAGLASFSLSDPLTAAGSYTVTAVIASKLSVQPAIATLTVGSGVAAAVSAMSGSGQSAVLGAPFATALRASVSDVYGNPVSGAAVSFIEPAAGASAVPSSGSATTGSDGTASVTVTANGSAGAYIVTAEVAGASSAKFSLINTRATSTTSVASSVNPALAQNVLTFTATVRSIAGVPTGAVNFIDNTTPLGQGTLTDGVATLTTSSLTAGNHSISADYGGDTNFVASTSNALAQTVLDFSLNQAPGNGGSDSGASQTALPGGTATYSLAIVPSSGTDLPTPVTLTVSGMPAGATAIITPSSWAQVTSTSWSFPANTPITNISLAIQLPSSTANLDQENLPIRTLPPVLWGILLLPFAGRLRRTGRRLGRTISLLLLLAVGMAAVAGLSGCGSRTGFFAQQQKTYTVVVTATSGTLSHSTTVTLTVE